MNRILKRRLHIARQFKAIGKSVSSWARIALQRLKHSRRRPACMTPDTRGRNNRGAAAAHARGRRNKSPHAASKKRRHDGWAVDRDGDVTMDMGVIIDRNVAPTFSMRPLSFSQVPSTPRSSVLRTPSPPQSSGSSFSQGFGDSPCPPNNAGAPFPKYSGEMEGVVFTSDQRTLTVQTAAAAGPRGPEKKGVLPFRMLPATAQPTAVQQPAPPPQVPEKKGVLPFRMLPATAQPTTVQQPAPPPRVPEKKGVLPFRMLPATAQPTAVQQPAPRPPRAQPAQPSQPQGRGSQATAAQPPAVPVAKDAAVSAPVWVTNDPAQVFKAPSWEWFVTIDPQWERVNTLPHLPPGKQIWDAAASAPVWAINDPAQVFQAPPWPVNIDPRWTKIETLRQPIPGAQPWDAAPFGSAWVTNDPAQVFTATSWDAPIAPLWTKIQTLRQPIPGAQPWDVAPFGSACATNDPAEVFTASSWDAAIAPLWTKIQTLRQPIPGTQPWDAAAFSCFWVTNDPAQVFTAPSRDAPIAPLWATIQTLPQLPRGLQAWGLVFSNPFMNNQPTVTSVQPATAISHGPSFDVSMQTLVGQLAACHVTEPDTWAWSEPSVFGLYMRDEGKGKNFQARLAELVTEANTMPAAGDSSDKLNNVEPQQGTQEPAMPQSLNDIPPTEANGSFNADPVAMILEQPSEVMDSQDKPAGTQYIEPTHVSPQGTPQIIATTEVPIENGDTDDAMEMDESQPTDKGKGVAVQGESNLTGSTFQFDSVPQLPATVNNPFINAPTFPTSNASATFQQLGGQVPLFTASNAGDVAEKEKLYEVGGDDDPNVDHDFDFSKHFRRAPRSSAAAYLSALAPSTTSTVTAAEDPPHAELSPPAATSSPIEAPSSADTSTPDDASPSSMETTSVEASTTASTPPTETPRTAQEIPPTEPSPAAEASSPNEDAPRAEVSPLAPAPLAGFTAQTPDPVPAASISFSAPAPLPGGPDLPGLDPSSGQPRGERKRIRDSETECMYDKDCAPTRKWIIEGGRPVAMVKLYQQHLRQQLRDAHGRPFDAAPGEQDIGVSGYRLVAQQKLRIKMVVAHIKAHPNTTYDEKYAMDMMNDMFYEILPRVISDFLFREPEWNETDREEEAKFLLDSMMEDELNEDSFDMVAGAYEPRFGHKFALCRENLFELFFSDWFLKFISVKLPNLAFAMEKRAINALRNPVEDAIWKYFAGHPPEDRS